MEESPADVQPKLPLNSPRDCESPVIVKARRVAAATACGGPFPLADLSCRTEAVRTKRDVPEETELSAFAASISDIVPYGYGYPFSFCQGLVRL